MCLRVVFASLLKHVLPLLSVCVIAVVLLVSFVVCSFSCSYCSALFVCACVIAFVGWSWFVVVLFVVLSSFLVL